MKTVDTPRWLYILMLTCTVVGLGTLAGEGMVWAVMGTPSKQSVEQRLHLEELRADLIAVKIENSRLRWRMDVQEQHGLVTHRTSPNPIPLASDDLIPTTNLPER